MRSLKCLETGGQHCASAMEKLTSHKQGAIEEAETNIEHAGPQKQEVTTVSKHTFPGWLIRPEEGHPVQ